MTKKNTDTDRPTDITTAVITPNDAVTQSNRMTVQDHYLPAD